MNIYVVSHYYDNGESYEDYREYETHKYYSTLELASSELQRETYGEEYEGQYVLSKVELDTQETECIEKTDYLPCHSMYFYDDPEDYEEYMDEYHNLDYLDEQLALDEEIEIAYRIAAGDTICRVEDWNPEWDHYCEDREKQITRIAHELADRHERLNIFDWAKLVWPFFDMYELNKDEKDLFCNEYAAQQWFRYGHLEGI